ncbi:MAG: leucine-rich repeat protein, partial [Lachnospiraceae bacterium]|nr:leucine-rich repeat protein [Lachnospiraceae bacterium]
ELTAAVLPEDAGNQEVTWSVAPEGIVTVEPDSENSCKAAVIAVKSGTATVTVTTVDGKKTAECSVTVTNPITDIAFESDSMELAVNEDAVLSYVVTPLDGDKAEVVWTSSDDTVVAISDISALDNSGSGSAGLKGKAKGSADITVTVNVNGREITNTCTVTVVGKKVESVTMMKDGKAVTEADKIEMDAKSSKTLEALKLSAEVLPSDADNKTVTWSIADKSIATIADGTITAHKAGTTKLIAKAGNKTAECTLVVNKISQAAPEITWTTMKRTSNALTIKVNDNADADNTSGVLEYTKDEGSTWQTVPEDRVILLTGLEAFTAYGLQVRLKGDDVYEASDIAAEVYEKYTLVEDAYTIDISKLPDENYIDALRTAEETGEGHQTVDFSITDMTLTLKDSAAVHEEGYVITGNNPKITVVVPDGVKAVTLDSVTCKGIVTNGNQALELTITGDNHVIEAVTTNADSEVTIQGSGSLDTKLICGVTSAEDTALAPKGGLTIAGGTVNVTGTEDDSITIGDMTVTSTTSASIAVDTLTVTGGMLNVTNPNAEGVGIQAGTITVTGGTVTITSEGTAIEAGDSVTISGGDVTLIVTGEDTKAVVSAENEISLIGGTVSTVKPEGNTEIFDFSVGDDGKIVVDGVELQGTPSYSKTPVDKDGHEVKYITVKFVESGKAEPLLVLSRKTGSVLDLSEYLKDYAVSKAGYELTWSADGKTYQHTDKVTLGNMDCTLTAVWTKLAVSMEDVTAAAVPDQTYTGSAICPKPVLTCNGATLTEGTDYTLSYQNNINVGAAVITATGQGAFTGSKTIAFTIQPKALDGITVQAPGEQPYTGKAITPAPEVYDGSVRLEENKDYTVAYRNNINAGAATVIVTGMGNYTGEKSAEFRIVIRKNATYTVGNYKYKVTNASLGGKGTVTLTKVAKKSKTVNIGNTVNIGGVSFKITAIGAKAFKGNKKMTTLKIGKNVTTIGANAFYGCIKLKTATIGSGVKKIGKKAFYNCKAMTKLTISSKKLTKKKIGAGAFTKMGAKNYKKLTVKVPKSKLKAYKKMLQSKGLSKKAKIKK